MSEDKTNKSELLEGSETIVDEVAAGAKAVVSDAVDVVENAAETVADGAAKAVVSNAVDAVENAAEAAGDAVEDVAEAIADGAKGLAGMVVGAASAVSDTAKDAMDELTGDEAQVVEGEGETGEVMGLAAFFNHPDHLMYAAEQARDAKFEVFDAYSPFPIHGMDDAMGLGRSWLPWVTFFGGLTGFSVSMFIQFGIMIFNWPMNFGGRPFGAWPSFVPILFELTVLFAGISTAVVMFLASGCFRKPFIIDKDITNDQFVLWISSDDEKFDMEKVINFMKDLNPHEIRAIREGQS